MSKSSKKRRRARKAAKRANDRAQHGIQHESLGNKRVKFTKYHYKQALDNAVKLRLWILRNPGQPLTKIIEALTNDPKIRMLIPMVWSQRWTDMSIIDYHKAVEDKAFPIDSLPKGIGAWDSLVYMIDETKIIAEVQ